MNLQKFISFACATDASRGQANKGKQTSEKSEQGKSSSSGATYKDKLKGKRPNEPPASQPAKKAKAGLEKQKSKQKAKDWKHNSCFICHVRKVTGLKSALTGLRIPEWILQRPSKGK
jgi:hypothetical protein